MATTIQRNTRTFSDLNLLFTVNPATLDVTKRINEEAVKASVRNLIQTKNFERPFHPEIGCQINNLLFENVSPIIFQLMKKTVFDVLEKFEPRIVVLDVLTQERPDQNELDVTIIFKIVNTERPITLRTTIQRVR
jgi:phage baseplate assembly protein W